VRTTLDLDNRVLEAAREMAQAEKVTLGEAVSRLARRGLRPDPNAVTEEGDLPIFRVGAEAPPITLDLVRRALDDPT
jgi:hypothetical protein